MDPSVFRCIAWLYESRPTTGDSRMKPFVSASYAMTDQYCLAGTLGGTCSRYDRWPLAGDRFTVVVEEGDEVDDASALTHTLRESERSEVRQPLGIDVEVVAHDIAEIRLHAATSGSFQVRSVHHFSPNAFIPSTKTASCSWAASRRRRMVASSGVNSLPFSMPMLLRAPMASRSRSATGSSCTMRLRPSKNRSSKVVMPLNVLPWMSMNRCWGGFFASASG